MNKDPHAQAIDSLLSRASDEAANTALDIVECSDENGLVKVLFCAMRMVAKVGNREHVRVSVLADEQLPPDSIHDSTTIYVNSPIEYEDHIDFAVWAYDHTGRTLGKVGWRRTIVEVNTKLGAAPELGASHLGRGLSSKDVSFLRFSSNEVLSDPWGAASKIFEWASWSFGY